MGGAPIELDASATTDNATPRRQLTYEWDFDNDGRTDDTGRTTTTKFRDAGKYKVALTVTDEAGNSDSVGETLLVRQLIRCRNDRVVKSGSWELAHDERANGGSFCRNDDQSTTRDVLRLEFTGPRLGVIHGDSTSGGTASVTIDGEPMRVLSFDGEQSRIRFGQKAVYRNLGPGSHTIRIVMDGTGRGFVEGFTTRRDSSVS